MEKTRSDRVFYDMAGIGEHNGGRQRDYKL